MAGLNAKQIEVALYLHEQELYRRNFYAFLQAAAPHIEPATEFSWNGHIEYICNRLEDELKRLHRKEDKTYDILVNQPPRTMKSLVLSVALNAWTWTWFPECKFLTISYSDTLASDFSYQTRLLINSNWYKYYFPDVQLSPDNNQKTKFSNTKGGVRIARGTGAQITGSGSDVIVADDLQKPNDISEVKLNNTINVWTDVIFNRLNQPRYGLRIYCAQRIAENDVSGFILANSEEQFEHINIPMELNEDVKPALLRNIYDPETKLLWVSRFNENALQPYRKKKLLWNSQYQQKPQPLEGTLIKRDWLKKIDFFGLTPEKKTEILSVSCDLYIDSAFTANPDRDETAVILAGKWGQNLLIKKCWILYLEFPDLLAKIQSIYTNEMNKKGMIRVEPKANGLSIIQTLKRSGLNVTQTPTPKENKVLRITSILNELEAGRVYLMEGSDLLIQQAIAFPSSGGRDGLIDVLYYSVEHNLHTSGIRITKIIK